MEEMKSVINSYDLMSLSWNDSQAFAPDGAIVLVTSTLNCNLVMCQAGESIIHCISAGERRLKVQDMPQVIGCKNQEIYHGEKYATLPFLPYSVCSPKKCV